MIQIAQSPNRNFLALVQGHRIEVYGFVPDHLPLGKILEECQLDERTTFQKDGRKITAKTSSGEISHWNQWSIYCGHEGIYRLPGEIVDVTWLSDQQLRSRSSTGSIHIWRFDGVHLRTEQPALLPEHKAA